MTVPSTLIVLCTGRCGSTTLARACRHLTSHTVSHEGRTHLTGPARLAFPPNHIEIDNRLAWMLGRLDQAWGDRAGYIHLTRNPAAVAESFAQRAHQGILKAYRSDILMRSKVKGDFEPIENYCRDYIETVTANITHFLRDKTHVLPMALETLPEDFDRLVGWAGLHGNLTAARADLAKRHNASKARTRD